MKIAYPCPKCGEVILSKKCNSCGFELLPETPKPKVVDTKKKELKKKPKRLRSHKFLKF